MTEKLEVAGGSIVGRDHIRVGKNCQDAYVWKEAAGVLVAVVCDGCGSSDHSEVGAQLGAKIVVQTTLGCYLSDPMAFPYVAMKSPGLQQVKRGVLSKIQAIVDGMSGSFSRPGLPFPA